MRTVKEVSKLTGVSVRTLHHYDAIGLLRPTTVTEAGYRLYDDAALSRLQSILLFRELRFPLKEIKTILDSPSFDPSEALSQQIKLLELQRKRLGELISYAREVQKRGIEKMNFQVFDTSKMEQYKAEVKEKWGDTKEYREFEEKQKSRPDTEEAAGQLMKLFSELGALRHLPPDDQAVQDKIGALQRCITDNFYTCTDKVFQGLGQMYVEDPRFTKSIDKAGGEGTAAFVKRAIDLYCAKRESVNS